MRKQPIRLHLRLQRDKSAQDLRGGEVINDGTVKLTQELQRRAILKHDIDSLGTDLRKSHHHMMFLIPEF